MATLRERFFELDTDRSTALDRKREHAMLTIPSLLPPEGRTIHTALEVPYSTIPAEGINSLASRITSVVFPLNGQSVFEILLANQLNPMGQDDTDLRAAFQRVERFTMDMLAPTNLRSSIHLGYKHLLTVGDTLLHMDDDFNFRVFRADQFVIRRKHEGDWKEVIICEAVLPEWEPDLPSGGTKNPAPPPAALAKGPRGEDWEALYTSVVKNADGSVSVKQEFRDRVVGTKDYRVTPYFPARWNAIAGEAYGVSLVEEIFGEIRGLDALAKALLDGVMLNSEYRWGVNPAGITELDDVMEAINGDVIPAGPGDVYPLQFQNNGAVQSAFAAVQHREAIVGRRFLMNSSVQPQGERVTARQVSILAQELESQLGGVLSVAARELQEPIIRRVLVVLAQKNRLPPDIIDQITDQGGFVRLRIRAGLEILNREAEREKMDAAIERMRNLPPEAGAAFNWPAIAKDWWESMGLESAGRIRSEEEIQQMQASAAQQSQQEQAMQAGLRMAEARAGGAGE